MREPVRAPFEEEWSRSLGDRAERVSLGSHVPPCAALRAQPLQLHKPCPLCQLLLSQLQGQVETQSQMLSSQMPSRPFQSTWAALTGQSFLLPALLLPAGGQDN